MENIIGYDPGKDYLLDPQARPQAPFIRCAACNDRIEDGDLYFTFCIAGKDIPICGFCMRCSFNEAETFHGETRI